MGLFDETDLAKKKEEQKKKSKKMLVLIGVGIFILLVALVVVLYFIINPPGEPELKVYFKNDGKTTVLKEFDNYLTVNAAKKEIESISVRDMAQLFGFKQSLGSYYDSYNEDIDYECYIEKNGIEVIMFKQGTSKITKHSLLADIPDQIYDIEEMVTEENKNFYINLEGFKIAFNCTVTYNTKDNIIVITSLEQIVKNYMAKSALIVAPNGTEKEFTYLDYCNELAILNGYFVIKDPSSESLGLVKESNLKSNFAPLADKKSIDIELSNILTLKANYKQIQYNETTGFFTVTTKNGNVGIYNGEGEKVVEPSYKSVVEIKKQGKNYLYVVKNSDNKWGIVNSNDKVILKTVYDQIGLDSDINDSNVKNRYILYDNYIPAKIDGKWVFFNLSGTPDLESIESADCLGEGITNIGCKVENPTKEKSSLVMVPFEDVDGLIVEYNYKDPTSGKIGKRYAVLSTARYKIEIYGGIGAYKKIDSDGNELYMLADTSGDLNLANYILPKDDENEPNDHEDEEEDEEDEEDNNEEDDE